MNTLRGLIAVIRWHGHPLAKSLGALRAWSVTLQFMTVYNLRLSDWDVGNALAWWLNTTMASPDDLLTMVACAPAGVGLGAYGYMQYVGDRLNDGQTMADIITELRTAHSKDAYMTKDTATLQTTPASPING